MKKHEYIVVDVFTDRPFGGNPLAVFPDSADLSAEMMQTFARELNLSETVFVLPPDDEAHACRLRIFTPKRELPMAGHPTIGTGFVLESQGAIPPTSHVIFEEGVGPIAVTVQEDEQSLRVEMEQPLPEFGTRFDERRSELARMLSLPLAALRTDVPPQIVSAGVPFLYVPVVDLSAMAQIELRLDLWRDFWGNDTPLDIFALTTETVHAESSVHSRMFAPTMNIPEDPATGAASGPLGAYLLRHQLVTAEQARSMIGEQGFEMGRPSLIGIHIETDAHGAIMRSAISGYTCLVGGGFILLD